MGCHVAQRRSNRVVAIDGPAASGKSSVARELSRRLGFVYVNSGAFYRAITWYLLRKNIKLEAAGLFSVALDSAALTCRVQGYESHILVDDLDPTNHLRDDRVNETVSRVSRFPQVRQIVSQKLHECADGHDVVIEGRDIGSVVFPDTPYKFYIDASPEVRLRRRAAQGERDEIAARDRDDVSRAVSPLVTARDAHVIDTSNITIEQVVDEILAQLRQKGLSSRDATVTNADTR